MASRLTIASTLYQKPRLNITHKYSKPYDRIRWLVIPDRPPIGTDSLYYIVKEGFQIYTVVLTIGMPVFTTGDYEFYLLESYGDTFNKAGMIDTKIGYLIIHS